MAKRRNDLRTYRWFLNDRRTDPFFRFRRQVLRLSDALDLHLLLPGEVKRLSGDLFAEAPELVRSMARALHRHPDLFPRPRGPELARRQGRVSGHEQVELLLERLLSRVRQSRVKEQSEAVRIVIKELDRIDQEDRLFYESLEPRDWRDPKIVAEHLWRQRRHLALWPVISVLARHRARCRPHKAGPKKGRKDLTIYGKARARTRLQDRLASELPGGEKD